MSGEMYKDISILEHIVKYCNMVEHSVERFGADYNTFMNDEDYKNSVSMCILQVGELVNHLSSDFKNSHKDIPWSAIVGMRNHFAHGYLEMDISEIWNTVNNDMPEIKQYCDDVLNQVFGNDDETLNEEEPELDEDWEL